MREQEFMETMGAIFDFPEQMNEEEPDQEIIYDWHGGVFHETEQNA